MSKIAHVEFPSEACVHAAMMELIDPRARFILYVNPKLFNAALMRLGGKAVRFANDVATEFYSERFSTWIVEDKDTRQAVLRKV